MTEPNDPHGRPLPQRLKEALGEAYTIEGEIGRGGMGVVYRARDERLQRRVAIKVLPPELAYQKDIRERFTREAQTAARLSHPNIVPIHDVGNGAGLVYFVMGYVEGESLGGRIKRRGKLPPDEARRIMKETADALSAAHSLSIIHRDIKPDNILLEGTRGRVMVTDFGIAKALSGTSGATLTGVGVAIGTPQFMSPEQAAGEREIDGRSDLYSLGVVTYLMLTGELPFNAPTVAGILMKQITEPAPVLHLTRPDIPEDLSLAVARCLEKDPENRWPTADGLRRGLESRTVGSYRPTATGVRAAPAPRNPDSTGTRPRTLAADRARARGLAAPPAPRAPRAPMAPRLGAPSRSASLAGGQWVRNDRGEWVRTDDESPPMHDTGEPRIVQKVRDQFARWAAVSGGCLLLNIATGLDGPWFLFVAGGMGIPLLKSYAQLWQAGYSWRDVLNRPPAHDAIEAGTTKGKARGALTPPREAEYGTYFERIKQVHGDRGAVLSMMQRLSPTDRELLPDIVQTTEDLYTRSLDLAKTLNDFEQGMGFEEPDKIKARMTELADQPQSEERDRKFRLLEQQFRSAFELSSRRKAIAERFESTVLAIQNVRYDLMRVRTSGVGGVVGNLTQATQAARALSRDVDHLIAAASEIKEATS
ncbi:MAG: serine/threonine protein kinase [Gemmatimonadetes bacterium]|nr:serine/threonine protein kinase [Gemmatimonadota bacterium]